MHQPEDHGSTTTVIWYRTPYLINNTSLLIPPFTLGNDVTLRTIIDVPCLLAIGAVVDLVQCHLKCSELNQEFNLQLDPSGKGLPNVTNFNASFTTIPDDVPSNVPNLSSSLQYISSNDTITPCVLTHLF